MSSSFPRPGQLHREANVLADNQICSPTHLPPLLWAIWPCLTQCAYSPVAGRWRQHWPEIDSPCIAAGLLQLPCLFLLKIVPYPVCPSILPSHQNKSGQKIFYCPLRSKAFSAHEKKCFSSKCVVAYAVLPSMASKESEFYFSGVF